MTTELRRRRFIQIVPVAGAGLLAACSDQPAPAPAPAPAAAPAPAQAAAPAPEPAPAPTAAAPAAPGGPLPMLDEADPTAQSLGYVADNSRVDRNRHASFKPDQSCSNCALYQGAAGLVHGLGQARLSARPGPLSAAPAPRAGRRPSGPADAPPTPRAPRRGRAR